MKDFTLGLLSYAGELLLLAALIAAAVWLL